MLVERIIFMYMYKHKPYEDQILGKRVTNKYA